MDFAVSRVMRTLVPPPGRPCYQSALSPLLSMAAQKKSCYIKHHRLLKEYFTKMKPNVGKPRVLLKKLFTAYGRLCQIDWRLRCTNSSAVKKNIIPGSIQILQRTRKYQDLVATTPERQREHDECGVGNDKLTSSARHLQLAEMVQLLGDGDQVRVDPFGEPSCTLGTMSGDLDMSTVKGIQPLQSRPPNSEIPVPVLFFSIEFFENW